MSRFARDCLESLVSWMSVVGFVLSLAALFVFLPLWVALVVTGGALLWLWLK